MNILLAFDKFKGSLTAGEACRIAAEAVRKVCPDASVSEAPLTDGGEGFCLTFTDACHGQQEEHEVADPLGRRVRAPIGWVEAEEIPPRARARIACMEGQRVAVLEMASASGLPLLAPAERDPWRASSRGTGQLIQRAIRQGADHILLGVGGSATNDCGVGTLEALGVRFLDRAGQPLADLCPERFEEVDAVDFSEAVRVPPLVIASDVQSPLLGDAGATRVFGPQKGLRDPDRMETAMVRMASKMIEASPFRPSVDQPGMGAAGGIAFGLSSLAEVRVEPGFSLFSDWVRLEHRIESADWVLTGEGRMDRSSLTGKGPVALLREAVKKGAAVAVFAGALEEGISEELCRELGDCYCVALSLPNWSLEESLQKAENRLDEEIAKWAAKKRP